MASLIRYPTREYNFFLSPFEVLKHCLALFGLLLVGCSPAAPAAGKNEIRLDLGDGVSLHMTLIKPGAFKMGSPESEVERGPREDQNNVRITKPYWLATTEFTQAQWTAVMEGNPSEFQDSPKLPVENVTWEECVLACEQLQERFGELLPEGARFSLPSEAQWEYACRAGTRTPFSFGSTCTSAQANIDGLQSYGGSPGVQRQRTRPVGSFKANAWGLHDMHGNVAEWVLDSLSGAPREGGDDPLVLPPEQEAGRPSFEIFIHQRVIRGGGWSQAGAMARSAAMQAMPPKRMKNGSGARPDCGFRPAIIFDSETSAEEASERAHSFSVAQGSQSGKENAEAGAPNKRPKGTAFSREQVQRYRQDTSPSVNRNQPPRQCFKTSKGERKKLYSRVG